MKKILFGSAAAIMTVVGFSSFKSSKHFTSLYYFSVNANILKGTEGTNTIPSTQVTYEDFGSDPSIDCPTPHTHDYYCWIGVTVGQVTTGGQNLNGNIVTGVVQSLATRTVL